MAGMLRGGPPLAKRAALEAADMDEDVEEEEEEDQDQDQDETGSGMNHDDLQDLEDNAGGEAQDVNDCISDVSWSGGRQEEGYTDMDYG